MIQIFTDTSANLPAAYIQKYSLRVIPLTYFVDGVEAHQDPAVDFDGKAYYDAMRSGTPVSTAMINLAAFLEPLHAALAGRRRRDLYRHVRRYQRHGACGRHGRAGAAGRIPGAENRRH